MKLSEQLINLMTEYNIKPKELAIMINVSQGTISHILLDVNKPTRFNRVKLAKVFAKPYNYFFDDYNEDI
jgi:transcriptional regulator with XRE-family HTH domain